MTFTILKQYLGTPLRGVPCIPHKGVPRSMQIP